ncbi:hypothetical protein [Rhizobium laguerreae]|uniref:hypothetical protein n=1 Tax=Rhizobium laguerreae TaxID=1076926 RepID=UPI0014416D97|nr:hypothetical protein [Rhizobium laguerreae]NKN16785.1 hypothetical protein [Rhizobium laguerreae]
MNISKAWPACNLSTLIISSANGKKQCFLAVFAIPLAEIEASAALRNFASLPVMLVKRAAQFALRST